MNLIDTHTHLYLDAFKNDRAAVIENAKANSVNMMLLPDIDSESRNSMLELHRLFPQETRVMIGLHPTSVKENYKEELRLLEEALLKNPCCAIGESGIDLYWDKTFFKEQTEAFIFQIELALSHLLPIVIHSRKSLNEVFSMVKNYTNQGLTGVFHCYPGNLREAEKVIEYGFLLGIGGVVTYKNAEMAEVVKNIDLKHIILETDAPFLPPVPYRGQRNESSYILTIAEFIAKIKNISVEEVAEVTTRNAIRLFNLKSYE
jgi:TatD DNase family protein